jgi:hypothetical protein
VTINISGQVPGKDHNGMYDLEEEWSKVADPDPIYAVVRIDRDGITLKKDGTRKPVMRFLAIVPLTGDREGFAQGIVEEYVSNHVGTPLPVPDVVEPEIDLDTPLADQSIDEPADELAAKRSKDKS